MNKGQETTNEEACPLGRTGCCRDPIYLEGKIHKPGIIGRAPNEIYSGIPQKCCTICSVLVCDKCSVAMPIDATISRVIPIIFTAKIVAILLIKCASIRNKLFLIKTEMPFPNLSPEKFKEGSTKSISQRFLPRESNLRCPVASGPQVLG